MALASLNQADTRFTSRDSWQGAVAAGAAAQSSKFVAYANLLLYGLSAAQTVLSTSTYTANGTATVSSQSLSLIVIQNTNTAAGFGGTGSAAYSTATYGPFITGGGFSSAGGTSTAQVNSPNIFAINTTTGTAGQGGVAVPAGAVMYVVSGTDATATSSFSLDYTMAPFAPVTI
jgi:hypothetical protein